MKFNIVKKYKSALSKLILLDYDGTLVSFASTPEQATPSVRLLNVLYKLSRTSAKVVIITGREYRSIDKLIGHLPLDIVAEHGAMFKENGMWKDQVKNTAEWKKEVFPLMDQITSECTGSFIEEKRFSLAWHYRNVDWIGGHIFSRELIRLTRSTIESNGLRILDGNKVVEIMTRESGKGKAVKKLVTQNNYDYILAIGDDKTDEEMFEHLLPDDNADTIKVGNGNTFAKYKLYNAGDVISLLEQLTLLSE